ncbi:MAG: cysteine desulfurase family protein [Rubripirellula sp.]
MPVSIGLYGGVHNQLSRGNIEGAPASLWAFSSDSDNRFWQTLIYLDYNRTTPLAPSVLEAMQSYWSTHFLLPGQVHSQAQAVSEALEGARENVASLVGCEPFEIVFTGGGTEANNLAIHGLLLHQGTGHVVSQGTVSQGTGHVLVSDLEHDSVLSAAAALGANWEVERIPCPPSGVVDPDQVRELLRPETRLVCVQLASPVLGTIQPVREIADACHNLGVPLHCDATQAFGKMPVDVTWLRADTLAVSGHKFYGPKGSGAVYIRSGIQLSPIAFGEPREMGLRPGAENVPAWIGLGAAASLAAKCAEDASSTLFNLRERFSKGIIHTLRGEPVLLCDGSPRLANTVALELPCSARQVQRVARQLVFAASLSDAPPDEMTRALRVVGRTESQIERTICVSLGWTSSQEQVDRAVELLADACEVVAVS